MYQYQRQQIRKRMEEKERQLAAVSLEREELKGKLGELQSLVTKFMTGGGGRKASQQSVGSASSSDDARGKGRFFCLKYRASRCCMAA